MKSLPASASPIAKICNLVSFSKHSGSICPASWHGGTGKDYPVDEMDLESFTLDDASIYLLAADNRAVWIGGARDLIEDNNSRSQFRQAIKLATAAYKMPCPPREYQRTGLISDLLSGHLNMKTFAA